MKRQKHITDAAKMRQIRAKDTSGAAAAVLLSVHSIHMAYAGPVVIPEDPSACHLVELLQLVAADLAGLAVLYFDLGIVANYYYHLIKSAPNRSSIFRYLDSCEEGSRKPA